MTRLVLVGGGHAHLHMLCALARRQIPGADVVLVAPAEHLYSPMIAGLIQHQYEDGDLRIDLGALARAAKVRHVEAVADRIDVAERRVITEGEPVPFDVCSLDVGSEPAGAHAVGMREHALALRPRIRALELRERVDALVANASRRLSVVVVGAGTNGVETAFAIQRRLGAASFGGTVTLVERAREVATDLAPAGRHRIQQLLRERGIGLVLGARVTRVDATSVTLDAGAIVPADLVVWAAGASAPAVLSWSDLPKDDDGYLLVDNTLRAVDGSPVFGAGDCIALRDHPGAPKGPAHTLREAPILECNLRAALGTGSMKRYRPASIPRESLNTGDGKAFTRWRRWYAHSALAWGMKDRADRAAVRVYQRCDETSAPAS